MLKLLYLGSLIEVTYTKDLPFQASVASQVTMRVGTRVDMCAIHVCSHVCRHVYSADSVAQGPHRSKKALLR